MGCMYRDSRVENDDKFLQISSSIEILFNFKFPRIPSSLLPQSSYVFVPLNPFDFVQRS